MQSNAQNQTAAAVQNSALTPDALKAAAGIRLLPEADRSKLAAQVAAANDYPPKQFADACAVGVELKPYLLSYAQDVPYYADFTVTAESEEAALAIAQQLMRKGTLQEALDGSAEVVWENAGGDRVFCSGETTAEEAEGEDISDFADRAGFRLPAGWNVPRVIAAETPTEVPAAPFSMTVFVLVSDVENAGVTVEAFATDQERDGAIEAIMRERCEELCQWEKGALTPTGRAASQVIAHLEKNETEEAWEIFTDGTDGSHGADAPKRYDDAFWREDIKISLPADPRDKALADAAAEIADLRERLADAERQLARALR